MPQRDYAARSNNKKSGTRKSTLLIIIALLALATAVGLWLLKENAPTPATAVKVEPVKTTSASSNLPSKPEEVYSYIRDLETREVITDPAKKAKETATQLSKEQIKQLEEKRKQEEATRLAAQQAIVEDSTPPTIVAEVPAAQTATQSPTQAPTQTPTLSEAELAAKKAQEQKLAEEKRKQAEEKRKQAELKKQQEQAKKAEQAKAAETATTPKTEKAKEPTKIVATAAKPNEKAPNQAGRFGLQCGAFKNKAQAENTQARLAMAGFNARIASSADWNRVFVGPIGDRATTSTAQSNARSVAECVIISM